MDGRKNIIRFGRDVVRPPRKSKTNQSNTDTNRQGRLVGMDVRQSPEMAVRRHAVAQGRWMTPGDVRGSGFRVAVITDRPGLCPQCRRLGRDCPLGLMRGTGARWPGAMDCSTFQPGKPVRAVEGDLELHSESRREPRAGSRSNRA